MRFRAGVQIERMRARQRRRVFARLSVTEINLNYGEFTVLGIVSRALRDHFSHLVVEGREDELLANRI